MKAKNYVNPRVVRLVTILALAALTLPVLTSCAKKALEDKWTSTMEGRQHRVSVALGGKITRLWVEEGDSVETGDTLAVLDTREIEYSLEQLQAGKSELDAQEALLNTQIAQAGQDLKYMQQKQDRASNLYADEVIPRQTLEDSEIMQTKALSQLKAAQQNLQVTAAKRKQLAAQEKTLRKKLDDCIVVAPGSGTLNTLYYREGEIVPPLGQLAQVTDTSVLELSIYVDESYLPRLKPGMQVSISVQGHKKLLPGKITHISNKAEFTPKTVLTPDNRKVMVYAVRISAENGDGILKDGMPVDVFLK